jgi:biotin carboxyl carrier protein
MKSYRITIKGREYEVVVGDINTNPVIVTVDGVEYPVGLPGGSISPASSTSARSSGTLPPTPLVAPPSTPRPAAPVSGTDGIVRALMPGRVISVSVSVGQSVTAGQAVLVMESMKMENTISAVRGGTVSAVLVGEGDSVQHGQILIEITSE